MGNKRTSQADRWERRFRQLVEFKKIHGHCNVPKNWIENSKLGCWVDNQRNLHRKKKLNGKRYSQLFKLGFVFRPGDDAWEKMFLLLRLFKIEHGNCNVPDRGPGNPKLAGWVKTQREQYKNGKLSHNHTKKLEDLGFIWKRHEAAWNEMYQKLNWYKGLFGNCNVPARWKVDQQLGNWVNTQRKRKKQGILSEDRIKRLDEVGFRW